MVAVIHALSSEQIQGRSARRLVSLLVQNTLVAILIGLLVANLIQPGRWAELPSPSQVTDAEPFDPLQEFIGRLPSSALGPLVDNNSDALLTAFSTASSTATMPITYTNLRRLEFAVKHLREDLGWMRTGEQLAVNDKGRCPSNA